MRWTSHSRRRFRKKSATSSAMRGTLLGVALRGCGRQAETGNARAAKAGQRSVVGSGLARVRKGKNRTALPDLDDVANPSCSCSVAPIGFPRTLRPSRPKPARALGVPLDELERAPPGVLGGVLELFLLAVEEAVRRALVLDQLVLLARIGQRLLERDVVLVADRLVRPGLPREDRRLELSHALAHAA